MMAQPGKEYGIFKTLKHGRALKINACFHLNMILILCYMMSAFDEELIPEFKKFASLVASNLCKISESSV